MIKLCIFDLDGTLLDTLPTIKHYLNQTLVCYGLSPVDDSKTKRYIGDGAYQLIYRAFTEQGITDDETINRALSEYKAAYDLSPYYLTTYYDGIVEMLDGLGEKGIALAVLSNKPDAATKAVIAHFFPGTFKIAQGGIDGIPLKPDSTAPLSIASTLGVKLEDVAFIGDTRVDVLTGVNMGAGISVGVSWGFRDREELISAGADAVIDHPAELIALLGVEK